jgi:ADP-ribosylglycohydrolase
LGYAVEFSDSSEIISKYGKTGITEYELTNGVAQISDDTQMTFFTANGLLMGTTRGKMRGIMGSYPGYISLCYKEWLRTQEESYPLNEEYHYTWLVNIPELFNQRAPGNTCISAIRQGAKGSIENPINNSKGCGGIMRVAPIGLYFSDKNNLKANAMLGAEVAALTHGHELGYIPTAFLVFVIALLFTNSEISIKEAVISAMESMDDLFPESKKYVLELNSLIDKAIKLSTTAKDDLTAIMQLGEGWVAEETLAIAVYCALKYSYDFDKGIIAAVNHSGDSDSTGAVTGNILGTYLGLDGIPSKYTENLELKDIIMEIADDLYNDCQMTEYGSYIDKIWMSKYMDMDYKKNN